MKKNANTNASSITGSTGTPTARSGGPALTRRTALAQALLCAGWLCGPAARATALPVVDNVTGLYGVPVARIEAPRTTAEVADLVRSWPGRVAVGGGRYSMGGQVAVEGGLHLDLRGMNRLLWLRPRERVVRVQAGMRWRDLQGTLDRHDLAVMTMQSYSNFTVGGSVSVNAHGRYVRHGPVGNSVRSLQLVLADGSVVEADPLENAELFRAAIGGYGAVGVITEVVLRVAPNRRIERTVSEVPLAGYVDHFDAMVLGRDDSVLHNADLLPPHFDAPVSVTWRHTDRPLTEPARLVPRGQGYTMEQNVLWALTELPGAGRLRKSVIHPLLLGHESVKWLNHEASLDAAELEPRTRRMSTYALQEYFIPRRNFMPFARAMADILKRRRVAAVNVSIRHSPPDMESLMPWAKEEVFSFVLYHKQRTHEAARLQVGDWTRELVQAALAQGGRYYLPYQLHATRAQFERAYPEVADLRELKRRVDPQGKFSNTLWAKYL